MTKAGLPGGYSLDAQKDRLEAFCKAQWGDEWTLHKMYRDTDSGTHMDRQALQELLQDAHDGAGLRGAHYRLLHIEWRR
jgi:DNA invertase Pin-like site-specific DNA recombinase